MIGTASRISSRLYTWSNENFGFTKRRAKYRHTRLFARIAASYAMSSRTRPPSVNTTVVTPARSTTACAMFPATANSMRKCATKAALNEPLKIISRKESDATAIAHFTSASYCIANDSPMAIAAAAIPSASRTVSTLPMM